MMLCHHDAILHNLPYKQLLKRHSLPPHTQGGTTCLCEEEDPPVPEPPGQGHPHDEGDEGNEPPLGAAPHVGKHGNQAKQGVVHKAQQLKHLHQEGEADHGAVPGWDLALDVVVDEGAVGREVLQSQWVTEEGRQGGGREGAKKGGSKA
jgi:hypothetical protein